MRSGTSAEEARALLLQAGIKSMQTRAGYTPRMLQQKAPDSIQVFAKKKKIRLARIWQKWVMTEWISCLYGKELRTTQDFWQAIHADYEDRQVFAQNKKLERKGK